MGLIVDKFVDRWIFYNYMACDHILSTLVSIDRKNRILLNYIVSSPPLPKKKVINKIYKIYLQIWQFPFVFILVVGRQRLKSCADPAD